MRFWPRRSPTVDRAQVYRRAGLTVGQREAQELRDSGLTIPEIVERLDVSPATVKTRLKRAKAKLAQLPEHKV